eukprot:5821511-Amphidinium_carterae.1
MGAIPMGFTHASLKRFTPNLFKLSSSCNYWPNEPSTDKDEPTTKANNHTKFKRFEMRHPSVGFKTSVLGRTHAIDTSPTHARSSEAWSKDKGL